jgi:hypothetical protein
MLLLQLRQTAAGHPEVMMGWHDDDTSVGLFDYAANERECGSQSGEKTCYCLTGQYNAFKRAKCWVR